MLGSQELELQMDVILCYDMWALGMEPGPLGEPALLTTEPCFQIPAVTFQLLDIGK